MPLFNVTEATIRENSSSDSFQRGRQYEQQGAVGELVLRGNILSAEVEGSEPEPYSVSITLDQNRIAEATCTCPYNWVGWCKHIVATLLTVLHSPDVVEQRPALNDLLTRLNRDELQTLILKLVQHAPQLVDLIEGNIALLTVAPATSATATTPRARPERSPISIDATAIRRQVRAIHRGRGGSLDDLLNQAQTFLEAGDGDNALSVLEALTDETVSEESFETWEGNPEWEDEPTDFFERLGLIWAEALLTTELTRQERAAWASKLAAWQENPAQYGYEDAFDMAIEAAQQGWDDPALQSILRGESTEPLSHPSEVPDWAIDQSDLTALRLTILDRQQRYEEYLRLAAAEDRVASYATMLIRLNRIQEAVDYSLAHLTTPQDALTVATALRDRVDLAHARQVAAHGMTLPGQKGPLAPWLRDLAAEMGDTRQALAAAIVTFKEDPSLPAYRRVQELAPQNWPTSRAELLDFVRALPHNYYPAGPVDIFLHEGLIDDAIAAVDQGATHTLVERVVDAAISSHPDWVIRTARAQAEPIMDEGKSKYYGAAAHWLARVRDAYRAAGRTAEWQEYYQDLLTRHARKYSLMPLLKSLRE